MVKSYLSRRDMGSTRGDGRVITFRRKERLSEAKMNALSKVAHGNRTGGMVHRTQSGTTAGMRDGRNYMADYISLSIERAGADSLIVRGGAWTYHDGASRTRVKLTVDGASQSDDPAEFKTLTDTFSASTSYTAYLKLNLSTDVLTAELVETSSFPAATAIVRAKVLAVFTTTADSTIPDIDPLQGDVITIEASFGSGADPDDPSVPIYDPDDGEFDWPTADYDYQVLQRKADDSIDFDWVRAHG